MKDYKDFTKDIYKLKDLGVKEVIIMDLAVLRRDKFSVKKSFFFLADFFRSIFRLRKLMKDIGPQYIYVNTLAVIAPLFSSIFKF